MRINHGHPRQALGERYGFVGHCVYRKVVRNEGDWLRRFPVQGEVHRLKAPGQGSRGVFSTVGRERGEGGLEACRRLVYRGPGANNPEGPDPLP